MFTLKFAWLELFSYNVIFQLVQSRLNYLIVN